MTLRNCSITASGMVRPSEKYTTVLRPGSAACSLMTDNNEKIAERACWSRVRLSS